MKHLIIAAVLCGMLGSVYAQNKKDSITTDTVLIQHKKKDMYVRIRMNSDSAHAAKKAAERSNHGFSIGLDFTNFNLGFLTLLDNGSFTLSQKNNFLSYNQAKTSTVGFDVFRFGYRFNDNFKIYVAGNFEWNLIRLQQNIDIVPDQPTLKYRVDTVNHYSKNRLSSNYFVLPIMFDFRSHPEKKDNLLHVTFGPQVGFLIDGMQKQISPEHGKTKNFNDFHFTRFEYGGLFKISYNHIGIFTKYYFNDVFENSPDQQGLKSFSFGLTLDL